MKRKIAVVLAALAALAMTACNNNNIPVEENFTDEESAFQEETEVYSEKESESFFEEETTQPIAEKPTRTHKDIEPETTSPEEENTASSDEEHGKLKCIWYVDGIALIMDGNEVQKIEMWDDIPSASEVEIADFNDDGYEDISIPQNNNTSYWIYNPNSRKFEVSYDLNSIKHNSEDRQ